MLPKTIIVHYKKLADRKQNILIQLEQNYFYDYTFYEQYDPESLDSEVINELYNCKKISPQKWQNKVALFDEKYHKFQELLNINQISLTTKLGKIFSDLSREQFDHCIIFEDDVILCDNFYNKFHDLLESTPKDWDAIYFGSCCVKIDSKDLSTNKKIYKKRHPASRGCDSIILKHKTVEQLSSTWFPFNLISDWEIAFQHYYHNHNVYWWEPSLTKQGSETGLFKTSLR